MILLDRDPLGWVQSNPGLVLIWHTVVTGSTHHEDIRACAERMDFPYYDSVLD